MKKIFVDKKSNVAHVVEEIIEAEGESVTLVIPKFAELSESSDNFALLKREAEAASKEIFVESVDEDTLKYAEENGIETVHPLLSAKSDVRKSLTDIVPRGDEAESRSAKKGAKGPKINVMKSGKKLVVQQEEPEDEEEEVDMHTEKNVKHLHNEEVMHRRSLEEELPAQEPDEEEDAPRGKRSYRKMIYAGLSLAVLVLGIWGVGRVFGKATAVVNFKKTAWEYNETVTASKATTKLNASGKMVPAQVFTEERNLTQLFTASSHANVSAKAQGKIIVFNAYSSSPQALVANTRFMAPGGKLFRLDKAITVPGAAIKDGKITPASVEAMVTADAPGIAYNIGPVDKLTIPGFEGTPKFEGFYGQMMGKMEGGFVGEKAVPTDDDIKKAKDRTTDILRTSLAESVLRGRADEFEIVPGATDFTIVKLTVNSNTDENGKFSIFGEARSRAIAFRKADIIAILTEMGTGGIATLELQGLKIEYADAKADLTKGEIKVGVKAGATRTAHFSEPDFKTMIAGKRIGDARSLMAGLPELSSANISLWPFWLDSVPADMAKIKVSVE